MSDLALFGVLWLVIGYIFIAYAVRRTFRDGIFPKEKP